MREWDEYARGTMPGVRCEACGNIGTSEMASSHEVVKRLWPEPAAEASSSARRPITLSDTCPNEFTHSTAPQPAFRHVASLSDIGGIPCFSGTHTHCAVSIASAPSVSSASIPSDGSACSDTDVSDRKKRSAKLARAALPRTKLLTQRRKKTKSQSSSSSLSDTEVDIRMDDSARIDASALSDTEIEIREQGVCKNIAALAFTDMQFSERIQYLPQKNGFALTNTTVHDRKDYKVKIGTFAPGRDMSNSRHDSPNIEAPSLSNPDFLPKRHTLATSESVLSGVMGDTRRQGCENGDASAAPVTKINNSKQEPVKTRTTIPLRAKISTRMLDFGKKMPDKSQDSVPEPEEFEVITENGFTMGKDVTSLMIRNIPRRCTQKALLAEIDSSGFSGCYDFCYLPALFSNNSNFGYAFVNLISPYEAQRFRQVWHRKKMGGKSLKSCVTVSVAKVQGRKQNIRRLFSDAKVIRIANPRFQPAVFEQGERINFNSFFNDDDTRPMKQPYRDPDALVTPETTSDEATFPNAISDDAATSNFV